MSAPDLSRWDWLLGSITLGTLGSLIHWLLLYARRPGGDAVLEPRRPSWLTSPWLIQPLRLVYAVGIPAAALLWQRTLTSRGLGLQPLPGFLLGDSTVASSLNWGAEWQDWVRDVGWAVTVTVGTAAVVAAGDYSAREWAGRRAPTRRSLGATLREAIIHQVHWAFYREPFVITWGVGVGSWLGGLPVLLETGLNPMVWEGVQAQSGGVAYRRRLLVRLGLFAAGALLYIQTQNLWLAIVMNTVVTLLLLPEASASPA